MQAKLKSQFLIGVTDTPEAMDKIVKDETENLTKVFKEAGIIGASVEAYLGARGHQATRFF